MVLMQLKTFRKLVSILVLMDLAHEYPGAAAQSIFTPSFNPCFNGSCSRMYDIFNRKCEFNIVSILVLMDLAHE